MRQKLSEIKMANIPPTPPKPEKKDSKEVYLDFVDLPLEQKISVFCAIKSEMGKAFELAFKQSEERACFLKQHFEQLMKQ